MAISERPFAGSLARWALLMMVLLAFIAVGCGQATSGTGPVRREGSIPEGRGLAPTSVTRPPG
jgi:hypothetical protein